MNSTKGGLSSLPDQFQVALNGRHCIGAENDVKEKAVVAVGSEKRKRVRSNT